MIIFMYVTIIVTKILSMQYSIKAVSKSVYNLMIIVPRNF